MITKSIRIADGVNINYMHTDKFKTNHIGFNFIAPRSKEQAHFNSMLPLIMMHATEEYTSISAINKRLQYLYSGDISAINTTFGEYQIFGFKVNMLNNRYTYDTDVTAETLDLVCQMVFKPYLVNGAFDTEYTEIEKTSLIDMIESEINNKGQFAIKRTMSEMCKDEVFSISKYGTVDDVKKITPQSLYNAYKHALSSYPIEIYVVGDVDFDRVVDVFKSYFKGIERNPIELNPVETVLSSNQVKYVTDTENVKQGKLVLGFRTGYRCEENQYHIVQLFNEVFGGSPTSKLFMNVREKMSLCYYCRSIINQRNGVMLVSSGIEFKNNKIAEKAIIEQLDMIKQGQITDEEFESAKKSIINGYLSIYDSAAAMEVWSLYRSLGGIKTTPLLEIEKINNTTVEQVMELANRMTLDTVYLLKGKEGQDE